MVHNIEDLLKKSTENVDDDTLITNTPPTLLEPLWRIDTFLTQIMSHTQKHSLQENDKEINWCYNSSKLIHKRAMKWFTHISSYEYIHAT